MTKMTFEDTNPENLETAAHDVIVTAYAAAYRMEAILWQVASDFDAWDDANLKPARERVQERVTALANLYHTRFAWKCHTIELRGNFNNSYDGDLCNYDVDDALRKEFGEHVMTDSESGWFVVNVTPVKQDAVVEFINTNFPDMDYSVTQTESEDFRVPAITNWSTAKRWLDVRDIKVEIETPKLAPKTGEALTALLDDAENALLRTGLSLEDATALLLGRKNRTI